MTGSCVVLLFEVFPGMSTDVRHTPLHGLHQALGARMAAFAGYDMPIQYPTGILTEHNWTRSSAGLFDVSHMGQAFLAGPDHATTAAAPQARCIASIACASRSSCASFTSPRFGL